MIKVGGNETYAGGPGGTPFMFHDSGAALKELKAWTADNWGGHGYGIQAIKAVLSNGKELTVGDVPTRSTKSVIEFSPGEKIKGSIHMSGSGARGPPCPLTNPDCTTNHVHVVMGSMKFETDQGQTFEIGDPKFFRVEDQEFDADGAILTGIFGRSHKDVDQLGFLALKKATSVVLKDVVYKNVSGMPFADPTVETVTVCNDEHPNVTATVTVNDIKGQEHVWEDHDNYFLKPSTPFEVDADVPYLDSSGKWVVGDAADGGHHWNDKNECSCLEDVEMDRTFVVKKLFNTTFTASQLADRVSLEYEGDMLYTFEDGTTWAQNVTGTYTGASVSEMEITIDKKPLAWWLWWEGRKCAEDVAVASHAEGIISYGVRPGATLGELASERSAGGVNPH